MNGFIRLPDDILCVIYGTWINLRSLSALDSAICNQNDRPFFLSSLPAASQKDHCIDSEYFFHWETIRDIKLSSLNVNIKFKINGFEEYFTKLDKSFIKEIQIYPDSHVSNGNKMVEMTSGQMVNINNSCLEVISLKFVQRCHFIPFLEVVRNVDKQILKQLTTIEIDFGNNLKNSELEILSKHCACLKNFCTRFISISEDLSEPLVNLIRNNKHLEFLEFAGTFEIKSIVLTLATCSKQIKSIFFHTKDICILSFITVINQCPSLYRLQIGECSIEECLWFEYKVKDGQKSLWIRCGGGQEYGYNDEAEFKSKFAMLHSFFQQITGFNIINLGPIVSNLGPLMRLIADKNPNLCKLQWQTDSSDIFSVDDVIYFMNSCNKLQEFNFSDHFTVDELLTISHHFPKTLNELKFHGHDTVTSNVLIEILNLNPQVTSLWVWYCVRVSDTVIEKWIIENDVRVSCGNRDNGNIYGW